jgi:hypothetical protein
MADGCDSVVYVTSASSATHVKVTRKNEKRGAAADSLFLNIFRAQPLRRRATAPIRPNPASSIA